jgi:hypothetical protein
MEIKLGHLIEEGEHQDGQNDTHNPQPRQRRSIAEMCHEMPFPE